MQQIVDYIAHYRDTYTREAISKQLLDSGYAQPDIDAAWQQIESVPPYNLSQVSQPVDSVPLEYITQYRDTYTREAISTQLLDSGYEQAQIDTAWRQLETAPYTPGQVIPPMPGDSVIASWGDDNYQPPRKERLFSSPIFWASMVGFTIISYLLPYSLSFLSANFPGFPFQFASIDIGIFGALQILAIILGIIWFSRRRPLGIGLLMGVLMSVVVLPFIGLFILLGICLTGGLQL